MRTAVLNSAIFFLTNLLCAKKSNLLYYISNGDTDLFVYNINLHMCKYAHLPLPLQYEDYATCMFLKTNIFICGGKTLSTLTNNAFIASASTLKCRKLNAMNQPISEHSIIEISYFIFSYKYGKLSEVYDVRINKWKQYNTPLCVSHFQINNKSIYGILSKKEKNIVKCNITESFEKWSVIPYSFKFSLSKTVQLNEKEIFGLSGNKGVILNFVDFTYKLAQIPEMQIRGNILVDKKNDIYAIATSESLLKVSKETAELYKSRIWKKEYKFVKC